MSEFRRNLLKIGGVAKGIPFFFDGWCFYVSKNADRSSLLVKLNSFTSGSTLAYSQPMYGFTPLRCWENVVFVIKGLPEGDVVQFKTNTIQSFGNGKHLVTGFGKNNSIRLVSDNPGPRDFTITPIKGYDLVYDNYTPQ